ncbi:ATP-binding protein [Streptomyces sp. NBC_00344]
MGETTELHSRLGHADLPAITGVRRELRDLLRHWGGPGAADVAELLTSELVTNALIHTDRGAEVTASVGPSTLRVEVRDCMPGMPQRPTPDTEGGTSGRGLVLVEALADNWGVRGSEVGKVIWFELDGGRV